MLFDFTTKKINKLTELNFFVLEMKHHIDDFMV